jgi:hypothetical protein
MEPFSSSPKIFDIAERDEISKMAKFHRDVILARHRQCNHTVMQSQFVLNSMAGAVLVSRPKRRRLRRRENGCWAKPYVRGSGTGYPGWRDVALLLVADHQNMLAPLQRHSDCSGKISPCFAMEQDNTARSHIIARTAEPRWNLDWRRADIFRIGVRIPRKGVLMPGINAVPIWARLHDLGSLTLCRAWLTGAGATRFVLS